MNKEEHIARHEILHRELDELVADMITHTKMLPSKTTVMELMQWSCQQKSEPAEDE